jgi:FkbM family methyltransferase
MPEVYSALQKMRIVLEDSWGLRRACGMGVAMRWLGQVSMNIKQCIRQGLQAADLAMGEGPIRARYGNATANILGVKCMGNIREIWVRDVYFRGGWLTIPPGAVTLDLGGNNGVFSMLALAMAPNVRAVIVEASCGCIDTIKRAAKINGWGNQLQVINAFVGGTTVFQEDLKKLDGQASVPYISEQELIERANLTHIDFLKCDIEGSEFDLFRRDSKLLAMADQIAIELHDCAGNRNEFMQMLKELGFEIRVSREASADVIVLGRRRTGGIDRGKQ